MKDIFFTERAWRHTNCFGKLYIEMTWIVVTDLCSNACYRQISGNKQGLCFTDTTARYILQWRVSCDFFADMSQIVWADMHGNRPSVEEKNLRKSAGQCNL